MKKLLIISPYFPPANAPDMQRIRMSLPYFAKFDWHAEIVTVADNANEFPLDHLLLQSIPSNTIIHQVDSFPKKWTNKFGLGSLALRSLWFYKQKVNKILRAQKFDLIYFSTTQFPVCILGAYWKKEYGIPYVIDMQDPWHSDYYEDKPKNERPAKYWFSYRLNKCLEPIAMQSVDGLISVSEEYITNLKKRYSKIKNIPAKIIPFGFSKIDFEIADKFIKQSDIKLNSNKINIIYTGAVGNIMKASISFLCKTLAHLKVNKKTLYDKLQFYFIGTSYATAGKGIETVLPIALNYKVGDCIIEKTDRINYLESIYLLKRADLLLIIGSDDHSYNPSKIFTYAFAKKPILGVFNSRSKANEVIKKCSEGFVVNYDIKDSINELALFLEHFQEIQQKVIMKENKNLFSYSAKELTKKQCELFNEVINN